MYLSSHVSSHCHVPESHRSVTPLPVPIKPSSAEVPLNGWPITISRVLSEKFTSGRGVGYFTMFSGRLKAGSSPSWPTATAGDPPRGVRSTLSAAAEEDAPSEESTPWPAEVDAAPTQSIAAAPSASTARAPREAPEASSRRVVKSPTPGNHPCLSSRLRSKGVASAPRAWGSIARVGIGHSSEEVRTLRAACVLRLAQGAPRSEGVARQIHHNRRVKAAASNSDVRKQYTRSEIFSHNLLKTRCESRREIFCEHDANARPWSPPGCIRAQPP